MNDAEIRMRCLEAASIIVSAHIVAGDGFLDDNLATTARADGFLAWVKAPRAPNGLPDTPGVPEGSIRPTERQGAGLTDEMLADVKSRAGKSAGLETGPDLPEHAGWAG